VRGIEKWQSPYKPFQYLRNWAKVTILTVPTQNHTRTVAWWQSVWPWMAFKQDSRRSEYRRHTV